MDSISLQLLVQASLAAAIPVLDNGMGKGIGVTEEKISDFAILTGENLDNLPPDFTICSSVASASFLSTFSPFQLLYPDHKMPWISIYFYGPQKGSTLHRMMFFVSFFFASTCLKFQIEHNIFQVDETNIASVDTSIPLLPLQ